MSVAIIGARWPDIDVECEVLGIPDNEVARDAGASGEAIISAAGSARVILAGPRPRFDAATIAGLGCEGIVRYGVGYENIDIEAARRRDMVVAYVPDYGTASVALHTVALIMAGLRRIPSADRLMKEGTWDVQAVRPLHLPMVLTVGVVGFGRIGRRVAELCSALGFGRVLAHDVHLAVAAPGVEEASLTGLLRSADVVTLHTPAAADGTPLVGAEQIAAMRPGSMLVNTARGSLIDHVELARGLRAGRPALAALDVFDPEPPTLDEFTDVHDRLIMTPHVAWYTEETERELRIKTAQEAARILAGQPVLHPVPVPEATP